MEILPVKKINLATMLLVLCAQSPLWASVNQSDILRDLKSATSAPLLTDVSGIYKTLSEETSLIPKAIYQDGKWVENSDGLEMIFQKNEPMALEFQTNGDVLVHILAGATELAEIPNQFLLSHDALLDARLDFIGNGDEGTLNAEFSMYQDSEVAGRGRARRRSYGSRRGRASYHIGGVWQSSGCLAYVQRAIGWNKRGGVGGSSNFAHVLTRNGWHTVSCASAQAGDVASWSGSHVAIRSGSGCWQYDLACADPGAGYGRIKLCVRRGGGF